MNIDVVCPLYKADRYIDGLIDGLRDQLDVTITAVFPVTDTGDCDEVINKIVGAGYKYFSVKPEEFSHSLTRQKAIMEYTSADIIIMMSQDVVFLDNKCVSELAKAITDDVVFAFGRQICRKKTVEYYVRKKNYPENSYVVTASDIKELQLKAFFASDAFSAYSRNTFVALGGYDGIHMMMNEDMYYAKKVLDNGFAKAYVSTAVVEHSHKFTLKQLYKRYFDTGVWFKEHSEFDEYKTTDTGLKLAIYVLIRALKDFNLPVLFRWLPDMTARYLGMRKGKHGLDIDQK